MSDLDFDDDEPREKRKPSKEKPVKRARDPDEDEEDDRRRHDEDDYDDEPAPRKRRAPEGGIGDYFSFKKLMITDAIQLVFWLGVAICLAVGGYFIYLGGTIPGIVVILAGAGLWRVICEYMVLTHRNSLALTEIKNAAAPPP